MTLYAAARDWANEHGHPQPDDRMLAAFGAALLRDMADRIDRGPTFPLPPSVISALVRERADDLDEPAGSSPKDTQPTREGERKMSKNGAHQWREDVGKCVCCWSVCDRCRMCKCQAQTRRTTRECPGQDTQP